MTMAAAITMTGIPAMTIDPSKGRGLRHELKHQINLREDLVLSQRLRKLFPHDQHGGADGSYRVTSLYFDTPYDTALREKLDGVNRREKFRLRYYGRDTSFIRLEKKTKEQGLCGKHSARMTPEQVARLLAGEDRFLLDAGDPLLAEFYSKLRGEGLGPKTVVCYDREAFFYGPGNVRITLDRNIRSGLGNTDFLNPDRFHLKVLEEITVLEVKYDAFLPDLVRMAVQVPGRQAASCSKYALCRRFD
ncbi:MAG: polyphosphate polymerase domain-containing protein [Candidatus Pararuminococcus gallinarum]|jgi:hypothetical protein